MKGVFYFYPVFTMTPKQTESLYRIFRNSSGVSTDSRSIAAGEIYFALSGERFDGHHFVEDALRKGASVAVIKHEYLKTGSQLPDKIFPVDDPLEALQQLALHHRRQFEGMCLALTGSNGKTTTRELLNAVLSTTLNVHATEGNLNNHIGVPLTILRMPDECELLLLEMGANHIGEIDTLCKIGLPDYGLVTNIAAAHLEGFGGIEGVVKAKGELYQHLCDHGKVAFYDESAAHLSAMIPCDKGVSYAAVLTQHQVLVELDELQPVHGGLRYKMVTGDHTFSVTTALTGAYNLQNIKAAIAVGLYMGIHSHAINHALEQYRPANMRSQLVEMGECRVILDAYNANPASMELAIRNLSMFPGKKLAVLGDMLELGAEEHHYHRSIIELALSVDDLEIICVGPRFRDAGPVNGRIRYTDSSEEAGEMLTHELPPGVLTILFKGSRSIRVDKAFSIMKERLK